MSIEEDYEGRYCWIGLHARVNELIADLDQILHDSPISLEAFTHYSKDVMAWQIDKTIAEYEEESVADDVSERSEHAISALCALDPPSVCRRMVEALCLGFMAAHTCKSEIENGEDERATLRAMVSVADLKAELAGLAPYEGWFNAKARDAMPIFTASLDDNQLDARPDKEWSKPFAEFGRSGGKAKAAKYTPFKQWVID